MGEGGEDCFQCRVVGVLTGSGLSLYFAHLASKTPSYAGHRSHRVFLAALSVGAAGVAVARAIY